MFRLLCLVTFYEKNISDFCIVFIYDTISILLSIILVIDLHNLLASVVQILRIWSIWRYSKKWHHNKQKYSVGTGGPFLLQSSKGQHWCLHSCKEELLSIWNKWLGISLWFMGFVGLKIPHKSVEPINICLEFFFPFIQILLDQCMEVYWLQNIWESWK